MTVEESRFLLKGSDFVPVPASVGGTVAEWHVRDQPRDGLLCFLGDSSYDE